MKRGVNWEGILFGMKKKGSSGTGELEKGRRHDYSVIEGICPANAGGTVAGGSRHKIVE